MRTGFKFVRANLSPFVGDATLRFDVGTVHRLPDGVQPVPCRRGFHYCPVAVNCLTYLEWGHGARLLRIKVPDDATIVTDDDVKFCASAIEIVEDVTSDAAQLLTGAALMKTRTGTGRRWSCFVGGEPSSRGLHRVERDDDGERWKEWVTDGPDGGNIHFIEQYPSGTIQWYDRQLKVTVVEPTHAAWVRLNSIMDARESFEEQ
jgi:hypothetical protein